MPIISAVISLAVVVFLGQLAINMALVVFALAMMPVSRIAAWMKTR